MRQTICHRRSLGFIASLFSLLPALALVFSGPAAASDSLQGKSIAMVIAFEHFKDPELTIPKKLFEQEGANVVIVSSRTGRAKGTDGTEVEIDLLLEQLRVDDVDAVIFVGGPGVQDYWNDAKAHAIARESVKFGKVLGAICWAPVILANAGVLEGKKATVYNQGPEAKLFVEKGSLYTGDAVTVDGTLITANGPLAAELFAKAVIDSLRK